MNSEEPGAARAATRRPLDARALARHAARLMGGPPPWLHEEVARRMAERLGLLKQPPRQIVDWGARLGGSAAALRAACPQAQVVAVEVAGEAGVAPHAPTARAQPSPQSSSSSAATATATATGAPAQDPRGVERPPSWWSTRRWWPLRGGGASRADAGAPRTRPEADLPEGAATLLWSNMVLHHLGDPQQAMARWLRLLAVDGMLMFSTLGPGTLASLRRVYAARRWSPPHAPFVDMHDLGDMLVQAGFADPVMDQEVITLTWPTAAAALAELRQLGGNADLGRHAGLRTPRWRGLLEQALVEAAAQAPRQRDPAGRVALEFEVVYGHAVRPAPRAQVTGETAVSLADMREMLRSRPSGDDGR